ncbi:hypothetical protein [Alteromonas profundi]|uniref:hypothetical protein n=1 Tax=Alteromonas profundi TaxID=2696062 RepID=UPI0019434A48|nr:hypothetical protein [Alteromonas profundi]
MSEFLTQWQEAAHTTLGLFWMAFWAFALGYLISSMIQVFVAKERMQKSMGETGPKSARFALVKGDLRGIPKARCLSETTMRNICQNLFLAFVYQASGIPIAVGVLHSMVSEVRPITNT